MTDDELAVEAKIYGVPIEELRGRGPSVVVTMNGVIASLVATETMVLPTGLREARKLQYYRGHYGQLTVSWDISKPDCYCCDTWLAHT